jgi:predicted DNA-binding transcriptional regulator YafY
MDANTGDSALKGVGLTRTVLEQQSAMVSDSDGEFIHRPIEMEAAHSGERAGLHKVSIYFSSGAAEAVSRRVWFEGQRFEVHGDRLVELSFEVASLEGLDRWVLGWGIAAVVMKPQALRDSVVAAAQAVLEKHAS